MTPVQEEEEDESYPDLPSPGYVCTGFLQGWAAEPMDLTKFLNFPHKTPGDHAGIFNLTSINCLEDFILV